MGTALLVIVCTAGWLVSNLLFAALLVLRPLGRHRG
jgi:hypothetical protein